MRSPRNASRCSSTGFWKATRERIARQGEHLPQFAQAHARQREGHRLRQPAAFERQLTERVAQGVFVDREPVVHVRQHACRMRIGCGDDAMAETPVRATLRACALPIVATVRTDASCARLRAATHAAGPCSPAN
jgi:hypothetical protein